MNKKNIIIASVVICLFVVSLSFILFNYYKSSGYQNNSQKINLPKNDFDAEMNVANTGIAFKYPSKGFYGLGIKITNKLPDLNNNVVAGAHIETVAEFDRDKQSGYVVAEINLIKNTGNFSDIEKFSSFFKTDSTTPGYGAEYAKENGHFVEFDNKRYFIFKTTEDATVWTAFAISKNGIVTVSLAYTNSLTPYSDALYKNNDELFLEILKNITF